MKICEERVQYLEIKRGCEKLFVIFIYLFNILSPSVYFLSYSQWRQ